MAILENASGTQAKDYGLVSVIMPCYNAAQYIADSIDSVISQTYKNWELIIIDDCSTDNSTEIIKKYDDERIVLLHNEKNSGAAITRNNGIDIARGEWMAFLDSDDIWLPEKLSAQLDFMKKNDYAFSCTAYEQIDEEDNSLGRIIKTVKKTDYDRLLLDCPVGNSSVMYSVKKMGKFSVPNIRKRNDDALWLQMLKKEKYIMGMSDVLMRYRIRKNSISSNKLSVVKYHWILYRDIEHLSVFRSAFHICWWCFLKVFKIK